MLNEKMTILAQKYFSGTASEEEIQQLHHWYDQWNDDTEKVHVSFETDNEEMLRLRMLTRLQNQINQTTKVVSIAKGNWYRFAAAASIIFIVFIGSYFIFFNKTKQNTVAKITPVVTNDIAPPKATKAIITLADGTQIPLDSLSSGTLAKQAGVNVVKTIDGKVMYSGSSDKMLYNILTNPRGSTVINLTLSDGTRVWLNSESSLRYPVAFTENIREVEITGEAYFEVSKDAGKKFLVAAHGTTTEVLGTHFNINSYSNESDVRISLLEGAVNVKKGNAGGAVKPGQQAKVDANGQISILSDVNIEEIMAWKNGYFNFEAADFQTIARQLSRWYDVDVVCERKVEDLLYAEIPRDTKLSDVLQALQLTGKIKFEIVGKKIIVIP